jgi:hypothetical protein
MNADQLSQIDWFVWRARARGNMAASLGVELYARSINRSLIEHGTASAPYTGCTYVRTAILEWK